MQDLLHIFFTLLITQPNFKHHQYIKIKHIETLRIINKISKQK
jgi:hypothetical protein